MSLVLLVDDNKRILDFLSHFLTSQGFEVLTASDGFSALKILGKNSFPDIIITDYSMPGMSGKEFTEVIYGIKILNSIPVIMISGSNLEYEDLPQTYNFKALIQKPFDINTLLQVISSFQDPGSCMEISSEYSA